MPGKRRNWRSTFLKYLLSYTVILIVPLLVMGFIIFKDFIKVFKDEVISSNLNILSQISNNIDLKFDELRTISYNIYSNTRLTPFSIEENINGQIEAMEELRKYRSTNGFIYDLFVYVKGNEKLYAASGTYNENTYDHTLGKNINVSKEDFFRDLDNIKTPTVKNYIRLQDENAKNSSESLNQSISENDANFAESGANRCITYFCPIPLYDTNNYGMVVFLIEENTVRSIIEADFKDYSGNTVILDSTGNIIAARNEKLVSNPKFTDLTKGIKKSGWSMVNIDGVQFIAAYIKSYKSEWTYISLVPVNEMMEKVFLTQKKVYVIFLMLLIAGSLLIYLFMNINYTPLARLKRKIEGKLNGKPSNIGDIRALDRAFDRILLSNDELVGKISDYRILLRKQFFINAINGHIKDHNEFNKLAKELGVELVGFSFRIAMIGLYFDKIKNESEKNHIMDEIVETLEEKMINESGIGFYGLSGIKEETVTFIVSSHNISQDNAAEDILKDTNNFIENVWGIQAISAVSSEFRDITRIARAYLEATAALDYRKVQESGRVIFYSSIERIVSNVHFCNSEDMKNMDIKVKMGNAAEVKGIISRLIKNSKDVQLPDFLKKCTYYDIINSIIKTCRDLNLDLSKLNFDYIDIIGLADTASMEEFQAGIKTIVDSICSYVLESKKNSGQSIKKIIEYIHQRYENPGFNVQELADKVGYSYNYLSRYFKEQTGYNISDYITKVRIARFKEMVKNSDEPISSLAKKVGYENMSSFSRRFKEVEGITPGQFKEFIIQSLN